MDSKIVIAAGMLIAIGLAGYLWYNGLPVDRTDSQEEAATTSPSAETTDPATLPASTLRAEVTGSWRSEDDPKFTRVFREDGTLTDSYEGNPDATANGSWRVVTGGEGLPASLSAENRTVIRISFPEEALFFIVTALTEDELAMAYVGGNGSLRFERIR
ncbi:MAG TPA: hypothetical protein VFY28_01300 [Candidatus Paceibacterota bacterium]|nr:hypothetical protein [Candidatus Paceibacterota bacterium]